jgi:hypothetical protein
MFLRGIEILTVVFLVWQVAFPLVMGKKLFPIFRKEHKLLSILDNIRQQETDDALASEIKLRTANQEPKQGE